MKEEQIRLLEIIKLNDLDDNLLLEARSLIKILGKNEGLKFFDEEDINQGTPLHVSVQNNNTRIAKLLLKYGPSDFMNYKNGIGINALHIAFGLRNINMIKVLVNGAPKRAEIDRSFKEMLEKTGGESLVNTWAEGKIRYNQCYTSKYEKDFIAKLVYNIFKYGGYALVGGLVGRSINLSRWDAPDDAGLSRLMMEYAIISSTLAAGGVLLNFAEKHLGYIHTEEFIVGGIAARLIKGSDFFDPKGVFFNASGTFKVYAGAMAVLLTRKHIKQTARLAMHTAEAMVDLFQPQKNIANDEINI